MSGPVAVYSANGGISIIYQAIPFDHAPTETDVNFPIGQVVVVESANAVYILSSKTTSNGIVSAHWTPVAGGTGIQVINGDIGSVTGNPVTFTGGSSGAVFTGSGSTMTESFDFLQLPETDTAGNGAIYIGDTSTLQAYDATAADSNIYVGPGSGNFAHSGVNQTGLGSFSLALANTASNSVALGYRSLSALGSGSGNVFAGSMSGTAMPSGSSNTGVGDQTASFVIGPINHNTLVGAQTGSNYRTGENSNILIGSQVPGDLGESHTLRIGVDSTTGSGGITRTFVQGIAGVTVSNSDVVTIDNVTGQMGSETFVTAGTFTPGIQGASTAGTANYLIRTGNYTRIGNFVFIEVQLGWNTATGTGQLQITGLPITVAASDFSSMPIVSFTAALGVGQTGCYAAGQGATTLLSIFSINAVTGTPATVPVPAAANLVFQGFYTV